MSIANAFNQLGQTVMPAVGAAVFPDTMTVISETATQGTGGGIIKGTTNLYSNVPVAYKPLQVERQLTSGDKLLSIQQYEVTFPTHKSGSRINVTPNMKLSVNARGNEPVKVFRIVALGDKQGVVWKATCEKEN